MQTADQKKALIASTALPELLNYIDGGIEVPLQDRNNLLRNPNTGEPLQAQMSCNPEQVERALAAAEVAYAAAQWENTPAEARADVLESIADGLASPEVSERMAIADSRTTGAVIKLTRQMSAVAPLVFRGAAQFLRDGHLSRVLPGKLGEVEYFRRPWGPALLVSPLEWTDAHRLAQDRQCPGRRRPLHYETLGVGAAFRPDHGRDHPWPGAAAGYLPVDLWQPPHRRPDGRG
mgnify:CR=1 FL=1